MTPALTPEQFAELRRLVAADPRADEKWMAGAAGHCNLVAFGGDDVSPVGLIGGEAQLALIVALRNAAPALLDAAEQHWITSAPIDDVLASVGLTDADTDAAYERLMRDVGTLERVMMERDAAVAEAAQMRTALYNLRKAALHEAAQGDGVSDEMAPALDEASKLLGLSTLPKPDLDADLVKAALRAISCAVCGGSGTQSCDDPQCADSTWDHACNAGGCSTCGGTGRAAP